MELFPPLFMAAFSRRRRKTLKAMVQAWPFACLPLGALMKERKFHRETFQAMLDGLDVLLAQDIRPRRWKLQVLDLRKNAHQDFWTVWSGTRVGACSLVDNEATQPLRKKQKVDRSRAGVRQSPAPLEVLVDLCLKEGSRDEMLSCLLEKAKEREGLLHLCCRKLRIFAMPMQNIKTILKMVRLDSVQDLEVNCTWKLSTLGKFALHLGQMRNLRRLLVSHIHMSSCASREKEEWVSQFTSQFLSLHHLQELYLDSISFLEGRLNHMLRCLKSPLETLSITNCLLSELDLKHLSQSPTICQLKDLGLSGVNLTSVSMRSLQVLLERTSPPSRTWTCVCVDPQCVWTCGRGPPVQCHPACSEPLLPAHHLQFLWEPHLHGRPREPPVPHHRAEQAQPRAVPGPAGELRRRARHPAPGEARLPARQAETDAAGVGAAQHGLVQRQPLSSLWRQDLLQPRTHPVLLLHACLRVHTSFWACAHRSSGCKDRGGTCTTVSDPCLV